MKLAKYLNTKTNEKQIEFILEIEPNIPQVIFIDDVRLRQILFNLVGNAVKFTNKGFVKLTVKQQYSENQEFVDLLFQVQDSGIGIPKEQTETIFKAFEQQKNQNQNKYAEQVLVLLSPIV